MDSFILYNMDDILNKFNIITNKCLTSTPLFCNINSNILDNYASMIVNNTNDINLKINIINKLLIIYPKKINLCLNMAHIYDIHNDSLNSLVWHFNAYNIDPFHAGNFNYLIKKLFSLDMHEKIIEICNLKTSTIYINPIGGKQLYDKEDFIKMGINLYFISGTPSSSILDICMNEPKELIINKLKNYNIS